jgi:hypothetical protein
LQRIINSGIWPLFTVVPVPNIKVGTSIGLEADIIDEDIMNASNKLVSIEYRMQYKDVT